ncbi:MAG: glyoxalase [Deltaproteobacteria bacterium]|nr:MAG: glyoxalase [Deltaproteobacteria bacterium]
MEVISIDHVQLAIPPGGEPAARTFYGQVLGFTELPKPEAMRGRGGLWFQAGPVQLHLGVEPDMRPSIKAHPALVVTEFDRWRARLAAALGSVRQPDRADRGALTGPTPSRSRTWLGWRGAPARTSE